MSTPTPAKETMKPRLLDLFCGAGGAGMGYHRAGFEVVGVDIKAQPRYPFEFVQGDALEYVKEQGQEFDVIHASPPCQHYTAGLNIAGARRKGKAQKHPELIEPTRKALNATGKLWVMENVIGSPLCNAINLCGTMFDLGVLRHRVFESNLVLLQPQHQRHNGTTKDGQFVTVTSGGTLRDLVDGKWIARKGSRKVEDWKPAMGINWMNKSEIIEAIPPAYTEFIGRQLMRAIQQIAA